MGDEADKDPAFAVIPVVCSEENSICGGRHFKIIGDVFVFKSESDAKEGLLKVPRYMTSGDENLRLLLIPAEFIMIPRKGTEDDDPANECS